MYIKKGTLLELAKSINRVKHAKWYDESVRTDSMGNKVALKEEILSAADNALFQQNLKMLGRSFLKRLIGALSDDNSFETEDDILDELRRQIPQLVKQKFVKELVPAGGSITVHKRVFLLSNNHVFAISEGEETSTPGWQIMQNIHDRMFSGAASQKDLAVFDVGKITNDGQYWYVEMNKIVPLDIYVNTFVRKRYGDKPQSKIDYSHVDDIRMSIAPLIGDIIYENPEMSHKEIMQVLTDKQNITAQEVYEKVMQFLPYDVMIGWVDAMVHAALTSGPETIEDAHFENIGIDLVTGKFIVFDIT